MAVPCSMARASLRRAGRSQQRARRRATASSTSASPMISGGSRRIVAGPVALHTRRCSSSARRTIAGRVAASRSKATIRPRPRTRRTPGSSARRATQPLAELAHARVQRRGPRARRARRGPPRRRPGRRRTSSRGRRAGARREPLAGDERADRQPAAERLGRRQRVGHDAGLLVGPQRPAAAQAALDLVEDQRRAVRVARLARGVQQVVVERPDAALALDRLEQHRRRALVDRGARPPRPSARRRGSRARAARTAPACSPAASRSARRTCARGSRGAARRCRRPAWPCARA